jgi:hypothetical protein
LSTTHAVDALRKKPAKGGHIVEKQSAADKADGVAKGVLDHRRQDVTLNIHFSKILYFE